MKTTLATQIIAFLLVLTLCLPSSAVALRGQQQEDSSQLAGLEEALKDPANALRRLTQAITPAPSQATGASLPSIRPEQPRAIEHTGLEEVLFDEVVGATQLRSKLEDSVTKVGSLSKSDFTDALWNWSYYGTVRRLTEVLWNKVLRHHPQWAHYHEEHWEMGPFLTDRLVTRNIRIILEWDILRHLLHNAVDAVVERWHPNFASAEIRIRSFIREGDLWVQMFDNGTGISPEILPRLGIEEITTKKGKEGLLGAMGRGVLIATDVASRWGWQLMIKNQEDSQGTVASLVIPLKDIEVALLSPIAGLEKTGKVRLVFDKDSLRVVLPNKTYVLDKFWKDVTQLSQIDRQAQEATYVWKKKPTAKEIEQLLREAPEGLEREICGVGTPSRMYTVLTIGKYERAPHLLFGPPEGIRSGILFALENLEPLKEHREDLVVPLSIHNHPYGMMGFPSERDLVGSVSEEGWKVFFKSVGRSITDFPLSGRRPILPQRHFVYEPQTGLLVEYGHETREPLIRLDLPSPIRLLVWERGASSPKETFLKDTNYQVIYELEQVGRIRDKLRSRLAPFYEAMERPEVIRVRMVDRFGYWAQWDRRVSLASLLRSARMVSKTGLEEAEIRGLEADRIRRIALQDQLQVALRDLTQLGFTYQILDQDLVREYPGLAVLSELHPGIWIDRSENQQQTDRLVTDLVSRGVRWVNRYGESERADRFQETAQRQHPPIDVRVSKTTELELLKQLLANLSGLNDPNLLEVRLERMGLTIQRVASWLDQLA